jgi:uncharacterized protein (TIGR02147 family)
MDRIETYTDYRKFLQDFYEEKKKQLPCFSYRYFCNKAGISSPALYREVVEGKRNLTDKTIPLFIKGMNLTENDGRFFSSLVHFNQSENSIDKKYYLDQMNVLSRKISQQVIPMDQYEYYSKWYYPVLRELACLIDWKEDYRILAQSVVPSIKKSDAKEGIEFLLEKGFLKKMTKGKYIQTEPAITSGSEVASLGVRTFNETMARRGLSAINEFSKDIRDIRTVTIGVSDDSYNMIKDEIKEFISRVIRIVDNDKKSDKVYNLGVQLFPLSRAVKEGELPDDKE